MTEITQKRLKELLDYDPRAGIFTWKVRLAKDFQSGTQTAEHNCAIWNGRFAGKRAGSLSARGCRTLSMDGKVLKEHRLAVLYMNGSYPDDLVDHKNLDPTDNRWENLREASSQQNNANRGRIKNKKHNLPKGVHPYWTRKGRKGKSFIDPNKFKASIEINGVQVHLGLFSNVESAQAAYADAAKKYFGEFARIA